MNSAPGQVTPAPHGPLALPGTYTVKLLVDGATYTQTFVLPTIRVLAKARW